MGNAGSSDIMSCNPEAALVQGHTVRVLDPLWHIFPVLQISLLL